jgi:putative effector of murein hydrolase LrgA (UPF0299 family)
MLLLIVLKICLCTHFNQLVTYLIKKSQILTFFFISANVGGMKRWGLRTNFLSRFNELDAGNEL